MPPSPPSAQQPCSATIGDTPGDHGCLTFFIPSYRFFSTLTTPAETTAAQRADPPSPGSMISSTPGSFLAPLMRAKTSSVPACDRGRRRFETRQVGVLVILYGRHLLTIYPRLPTKPGRSTSGFGRPGKGWHNSHIRHFVATLRIATRKRFAHFDARQRFACFQRRFPVIRRSVENGGLAASACNFFLSGYSRGKKKRPPPFQNTVKKETSATDTVGGLFRDFSS